MNDWFYFIDEKNVNCSKATDIFIYSYLPHHFDAEGQCIVKNNTKREVESYFLINCTINTKCDFSKKKLIIFSNYNFIENGNYIENLENLNLEIKISNYPDIKNIKNLDIIKYDEEVFKKYNFESIYIKILLKRKFISDKNIILKYFNSKLKSLKIKNVKVNFYANDKVKDKSYSNYHDVYKNGNKYLVFICKNSLR